MNFWQHLDALRLLILQILCILLFGFFASFFFHQQLLRALLSPVNVDLALLSPIEGFLTAIKVSFVSACVLTSPLWLYQIMRFLTPALKAAEKRCLRPLLLLSALFVTGGVLFGYYITLPFVLHFLNQFNAGLGIHIWSLSKTLDFVLSLIFAHGFAFELFVMLLILVHFHILSFRQLVQARKVVIVAILSVSALLTPPDVFSQLLLSAPLILFYEEIILYARMRKYLALEN